jgi:cyclophilin family peptidyl-prolyl cis-trans isomerase
MSRQNTDYEPPSKLAGVIMAIVGIVLVLGVITYIIPKISNSSDEQVALLEKKKEEAAINKNIEQLNKNLVEENTKFGFTTQIANSKPDENFGKFTTSSHMVKLTTNFGDLRIKVDMASAPKSAENFVRLASRNYYQDTAIHRIVKGRDFAVIQGGDKNKKDGTGGQSAFYISDTIKNDIPDEAFRTKPEFNFNEEGQPISLKNDPVFMNPNWYKNFNRETGEVEYPKGLIIMANSGSNTGGSQFFITLDKTILPAQYTAFGEIQAEDFATLDKIQKEVNPAYKEGETLELLKTRDDPRLDGDKLTDGIPDKPILISGVEVIN